MLAYEIALNCWGDTGLPGSFAGAVYVPVKETDLRRKLAALKLHASQMAGREDTIIGSAGVEALARLRGLECGAPYAEKFYAIVERLDL